MAAEIAGALAVGACCPVCGSADHPQKARAAHDAPDALGGEGGVARCSTTPSPRSRRATGWSATSRPGWRWPVSTRATRSTTCCAPVSTSSAASATRWRPAPASAAALARRLEATEEERDRLAVECGELDLEVATLDDALRSRAAERAALQAELDAVLAGARDLAARLAAHQARLDVGRAALRALDEAGTRDPHRAPRRRRRSRTAAAEAGFADAAGAADALLDPGALGELERRVGAHEQRLAAVTAVLEEPGAAQDAAAAPPDLPVLEQQRTQAPSRPRGGPVPVDAVGQPRGAARGPRRPARGGARRVEPVARVARAGHPAGGVRRRQVRRQPLQMRLSAYVLAYRLSQVVAAANERLSPDERPALRPRAHRAPGRRRDPRRAQPAPCATTGPASRATRPPSPAARRSWSRWPWPSGSPT